MQVIVWTPLFLSPSQIKSDRQAFVQYSSEELSRLPLNPQLGVEFAAPAYVINYDATIMAGLIENWSC